MKRTRKIKTRRSKSGKKETHENLIEKVMQTKSKAP